MRRVLCASDFSEVSDEALRQADALARGTGAALGVCHVVPNLQGAHPLFPQHVAGSALDSAELEGRVGAALEERVKAVTGRSASEVELRVAMGASYAEILRHAESWSADVVVIGSHGRSGIARLLLGSVASEVVRYAHCPVLVARKTAASGCVLAATDLSDGALPAVKAAAAEAARRKVPLVVVHVIEADFGPSFAALGSPFGVSTHVPSLEVVDTVTALARTAIESGLEKLGVKGEVHVLQGTPATMVTEKAAELGAQLVVVGTRGRTGIARITLGSVADRIVQTASSSVLAVRLSADSDPA